MKRLKKTEVLAILWQPFFVVNIHSSHGFAAMLEKAAWNYERLEVFKKKAINELVRYTAQI